MGKRTLRRWTTLTAAMLVGTWGWVACSGPARRSQTPEPTPGDPLRIETALDFGASVRIDFAPAVPRSVVVQVALPEVPEQRAVAGEAVLDKSAVRLEKLVDVAPRMAQTGEDRATVTFLIAPNDGADACETGTPIGTFTLILNEAGDDFTIEPASVTLSEAVLDVIARRDVRVCVQIEANYLGRIEIDALGLTLTRADGEPPDSNANVNENTNASGTGPSSNVNQNAGPPVPPAGNTSNENVPEPNENMPPVLENDCDGNGIEDAEDIAAGASDCDGSGVPDVCELAGGDCDGNGTLDSCQVASGGAPDCNGNGLPDMCDLPGNDCDGNFVPDDCQPDGDGDGVIDECDNCREVANPDQADNDNDGTGNICEELPPSGGGGGGPPPPPDTDGDGIPDPSDNCPATPNTDQADSDEDGVGDACDNCPATPNTDQADSDEDGYGDVCDGVLFVDENADGALDGSSWVDAFNEIRDALNVAAENPNIREIWVAEGDYKPAEFNGPPGETFRLRSGLALYGGFAGGETSVAQAQPQQLPTILSGDLNDDDPNCKGICDVDNSFHVVTAHGVDGTAILDGFVIRFGSARAPLPPHDRGGGLVASGGSPTIRRCRFLSNTANYGGGGIYVSDGSQPSILNCLFQFNSVLSTDGNAGGGGVYAEFDSHPQIVNCFVRDNFAQVCGGGIFCREQSDGAIVNCDIDFNFAGYGGGLCVARGSNPIVSNCTIRNNFAFDALGSGGGVYVYETDQVLSNCILWGNFSEVGPQISVVSCPASVSLSYCDVESGPQGVFVQNALCTATFGPGNIAVNPMFGPNGSLTPGSPCIDAGSNPLVAADGLDLDGDGDTTEPVPVDIINQPRFVDFPQAPDTGVGPPPVVDMGAFEFQNPGAGACCLPGGGCQVLPQPQCVSQGGAYLGDGVPCSPNPCGA